MGLGWEQMSYEVETVGVEIESETSSELGLGEKEYVDEKSVGVQDKMI